jgi:branched-chain amino acid transport system substrate-binding protein
MRVSTIWQQLRARGQVVLGVAAVVCASVSMIAPAAATQPAPANRITPATHMALMAGQPIRVAMIEGLSGPFTNTGEAVYRNLAWAAQSINAKGGVTWGVGAQAQQRPLEVVRFDSKSRPEEALSALRSAIDQGIRVVVQGNSSAVALALVDAINKHNQRDPANRVVFLNYSAVEPSLTNEACSFWHFRFDAHANMRMSALMQAIQANQDLKRVYLIGQDYSFGQSVVREAAAQLASKRPDIEVVGRELHAMARIKDFAPYAAKIKASGAQAVITGNWGNDLTLLVKAAKDVGFDGTFYTFYGNALGAPAAIGQAGVGKVLAVAEWFPNDGSDASSAFYKRFKASFPSPEQDYVHMRMQGMMQALANGLSAASRVGNPSDVDAYQLALALERTDVTVSGHRMLMRVADHQIEQPLVVAVMDEAGRAGVPFDTEGSGFGFRVVLRLTAQEAALPTTCEMVRPE